jgi:IS5 family transposase
MVNDVTCDQAIGRSRGGLTTKIHALGNPANLMLTAGQIHDLACAQDLIENADPEALIADKAYDADPLINRLTEREITPVIPPQMQSKDQTRLRLRTLLRAQPHRALQHEENRRAISRRGTLCSGVIFTLTLRYS